ncbi:TPM domain-containing protein [uncultured Rikenella sp.]|uniref:TPM domain-containing protein n=1 Tax=uncultured Rikenella sp. TaxID=368003 RepID=UPI0026033CFF|nr:TPM domain-containing protein [uncultured Rikenella sp.]
MLRVRNIRSFVVALVLVAGFAVFGAGDSYAQPIPQPMSPPRLVNDYAHLFSGAQLRALEDSLVAFDRATSTQVAVVTVNDLDGYPASEYATRILEKWGVGSKEHDNGVVMLVKPRNRYGGGEVFIAVGYGLEGALPDITAGRIIDNDMMPYLQGGDPDYYGAVAAGTAAVRAAVRGEYQAVAKKKKGDVFDWISGLFSVGVIVFIFIILSKSYKGGGDDEGGSGGGSDDWRRYRRGPIVFPPIIGGFGGRGGGLGGGGFGGFGGGMGGGGGAGRSF